MVVGLVAGLAAALLFGIAAVLQAHAVRRQPGAPDHLAGFVAASLRDGWTMAVLAMYLGGFVLHAVAIWELPLYLAQATVAVSLPVTAVASMVLHERLAPVHWSALVVVTGGLVLLSLSAGDPGTVVVDPLFVGLLAVGAAVLVLVSLAGHRLGGPVLGAVAGLGYAGSAIAVRGVHAELEPMVVAAALGVPAYSLVAFWLYSLGMDRAGVSQVTAPLIVGQTFVPALVGVALLGDGVREGWWPGAVAGTLLATAGAVLLSRDQAGPGVSPGASGRRGGEPASATGPAPRRLPAPRRSSS